MKRSWIGYKKIPDNTCKRCRKGQNIDLKFWCDIGRNRCEIGHEPDCMFPLGSCGGYKGLLKIASLDQAAEFFRFSTRTPSILARVEKAKYKWCIQKSTSRGPLRNPLCLGFPNQLQPVKFEGVAPTQESNLITTYGSKARLANIVKEKPGLIWKATSFAKHPT